MRPNDPRRLEELAIDLETMAQYLGSGGRPTEFFASRVTAIADELVRLAARWHTDPRVTSGRG
jgi:hypothetical protein